MDESSPWGEIQRQGAIASFVLPLLVGEFRMADEIAARIDWVAGTGFLIAEGRGLGITARHVIKNLLAHSAIPDLWAPASMDIELRIPLAMFIGNSGETRCAPIVAVDLHPTEDLALFRLPDQHLYSPFTISAAQHESSAEYSIWGYPDEVRHDYFSEKSHLLNVPLIYEGGFIRRRLTAEIPPPGPLGRMFYELTRPAGQCCSGAPLTIRTDPWRAIGVYTGERRSIDNTFSVGYATRADDAIARQWPQLVKPGADLSTLCPLPSAPKPT